MKRIIIALLFIMVFVWVPSSSYAKKKIYVGSPTSSYPSSPRRSPVLDIMTTDVNQESCELNITLNYNVPDMRLYLTSNGTIYEEDEFDGVSGQMIIYNLEDYEIGAYTLTIEVDNTTIAVINIIIEE